MKFATLHVGHDVIEAQNNMFTGTETVTFNGREVSRQQNAYQGTHRFNVEDPVTGHVDEYRVEFRMTWKSMWGVAVSIYRNDECLFGNDDTGGKPVTVRATRRGGDDYDRSAWTGDGPEAEARGKEPLYSEDDLV